MKRTLLVVAAAVALALCAALLLPTRTTTRARRETATPPQGPHTARSSAPTPAHSGTPLHISRILPGVDPARDLNHPTNSIQDDLAVIASVLHIYRKLHTENPVGTNEEITHALIGENVKKVAVIDAEHRAVSAEGELIDRWGTPLFFHQLSADSMEIRSAGPDRKMWTSDDVQWPRPLTPPST